MDPFLSIVGGIVVLAVTLAAMAVGVGWLAKLASDFAFRECTRLAANAGGLPAFWAWCRAGKPQVPRILYRSGLATTFRSEAEALAEIGRLRAALHVNGLRWGVSEVEIDRVLNPSLEPGNPQ